MLMKFQAIDIILNVCKHQYPNNELIETTPEENQPNSSRVEWTDEVRL